MSGPWLKGICPTCGEEFAVPSDIDPDLYNGYIYADECSECGASFLARFKIDFESYADYMRKLAVAKLKRQAEANHGSTSGT